MDKKTCKYELVSAKPNILAGSRDGCENVYECRILLVSLFMVNSGVDITKEFSIDVKYVLGGADCGDSYKALKEACKTIVRRSVNLLPDNARGFKFRNVISVADYIPDKNAGEINIQFNPLIAPHIIKMFEEDCFGYTKIMLRYALPIRSLYSVRLYELLLRNKYKGEFVASLIELRNILGTPKKAYIKWAEFDRNILKVAQKNMKRYTNLSFKYEGKRASRKIDFVAFKVVDNTPVFNRDWGPKNDLFIETTMINNNDEIEDKENPPEHIKIVRENIWEKSQKEVLEKYPEKMIMYYYNKMQKQISSGKNLIDHKSYFYTLLKKDTDDYGNIEAAELILKQKQDAAAEEKKKLEEAAAVEKKRQECLMSLATKYLALLPARDRDKYMFSRKIPSFLPGQLRREAAAELLLRDNGDLLDKKPDEETFLAHYKCMETE